MLSLLDEQVTSRLVEQAIPLLPCLRCDEELTLTYDQLERAWEERVAAGKPHDGHTYPSKWHFAISGPFREEVLVDTKHEHVYEALRTVVFSDRASSPWGKATAQAQDWLFAPDEDTDRRTPEEDPRPTDTVAATVLLVAVYGDDAQYLLHLIP